MRRFFICFLLCLMPLRMWASAWMPMAENTAFATAVQASMNHEGMHHEGMNHASLTHEGVACHEALQAIEPQESGSMGFAALADQDVAADVAMQKGACHDGHCQFCGVCHQTASPMGLTFVKPVFKSYPLPLSVLRYEAGVVSPPLIKPPIS